MIRQKKQTLVIVILLALVLLAYFLIKLIPEDTEETTTILRQKLLELDTDTITDLYFNGTEEDIHFYKDADGNWTVEGHEDEEASNTYIKLCLNASANLSIDSVIPGSDYAEYGLDNPGTTVKVVTETEEHTIKYGIFNSASEVYYIMIDNDPTIYVYTHSKTLPFNHEVSYYLEDSE